SGGSRWQRRSFQTVPTTASAYQFEILPCQGLQSIGPWTVQGRLFAKPAFTPSQSGPFAILRFAQRMNIRIY
ncbi:hypothetical protein, partial [Mesorhizobium sp. M2E.F.Ca.ET.209.01.1.1]|uniref:hypothetical protein n=1 Tax=Mesorhizobium sp. M2E.F.Ca.ET.209.01.1.1 TaxID=2500526 RepID=UPI001AED6F75